MSAADRKFHEEQTTRAIEADKETKPDKAKVEAAFDALASLARTSAREAPRPSDFWVRQEAQLLNGSSINDLDDEDRQMLTQIRAKKRAAMRAE